jgi:hypothetical protein
MIRTLYTWGINMMRKASVMAVAAAALVSASVAQANDNSSPLAAGKPAGVKQAQLSAPLWAWVAGIGFVALAVGIAASPRSSAPVTSSTGTAP